MELREELKPVESWKQLKEIFENLAEDEELRLFIHSPILGYSYSPVSFKRAGEDAFVVNIEGIAQLVYTITKDEAVDLAWYWVKDLKFNKYAVIKLPPKLE